MAAQGVLSSILAKLTASPSERGFFRMGHMAVTVFVAFFLLTRTLTKTIYVDFSAEIFEFLFLAGLFLASVIALLPRRASPALTRAIFLTEIFFLHGVAHYSSSPAFFTVVLLFQMALLGYQLGKKEGIFYGMWASACFNFFLILSGASGQVLVFQILTNNLTLVGAGFLSGLLRDQLRSLRAELTARDARIELLKQLNHLIVENIPIGVLTLDAQGVVVQNNAAAARIFDWLDFNQLSGLSLERLWPESPLKEWMIKGAPDHAVELQIQHPLQGEIKVLKVTMTPIAGTLGQELGFLLGVEDLTQIKQLEQTMRQSEKLAAVGQLASGIAHEIRNPLASISGSVQMLATILGSASEDGDKLVKITLREIDRLNNMITEFLDFVKPETSHLKLMDLSELINEVIQLLQVDPNISRRIQLHAEVQQELWIMGDRDKLKQAFLNIMINGCQAMESVEQAKLSVRGRSTDAGILLEIQDNGMGMDEKTQKRIFEPFLTTKPKGTGLGLSVTHRIIENHQGKIYVQSQLGAGSNFKLEFPAPSEPHQKLRA